ncbi:hypothetical protein J5N97_017914 [Dioscorea zingiberensis]|uniref:ENTH domain-containing protein n=1 Tax=Dioscorea zingiberensis TaxID=325984 RepID=A0A9D5HGT5_9LILI|nr:hypothetical protein J5N97_017914 [Dioscorea zingiberensis]
MGRKLRSIVEALKDKASQTKASLLCTYVDGATTTATTSSAVIITPHLAVLRATPHHPPDSPPDPRHLSTLLSFGSSPRPAAAALLSSLTSRLLSTRNPSVALKSLLALRHLHLHGAFILRDQLLSALSPSPGSRHPLHLSPFPHSLPLSSWARWLAALLELLLAAPLSSSDPDSISSLLNDHLLRDLNSLTHLLLETRRFPPFPIWEENALVREVVRVVAVDALSAERAILLRLREARERLASLDYADSVELLCLLRRLDEQPGEKPKPQPFDLDPRAEISFWREVKEVREVVNELVTKRESEKGRLRTMRRERLGESDRFLVRSGLVQPVRSGSFRFV